MLKGRLGLDSAKVPHADRAGLLYLARGALTARDGTLVFLQGPATAADALEPGDYAIPLQAVSMILLGPGSTVSYDALRLLAHAPPSPRWGRMASASTPRRRRSRTAPVPPASRPDSGPMTTCAS